MAAESDISFALGTIGLVIPFILTENGVPVSNATSAAVTWVAMTGERRPLTLTTPVSAVFTYTVSANDWRTPRREIGYLLVSYGTNVYPSLSNFTVNVFRRPSGAVQ